MSKTVLVALTSTTVLVLDQLTKWWIRQTLRPGDAIRVLDSCFNIVHARNPGGAFSFLAGASEGFRSVFFLIASIVAIGVLFHILRTTPAGKRLLIFALAGLLGGALGNLIDRVRLGHVTDFLDVYWNGYHWPAFNVADSFITVGLCILVMHVLFGSDAEERDP
jgi:signal peptidase II